MAKGTAHESVMPAGTIVRLLTHSAMFDPYAYEDPDRFNPNRIFDHNFNFGFGQHQCLGKYVGMEMIPEMVRQVLLLGDLRSDGPISYRNDCFPDRDGPFPEQYRIARSEEHTSELQSLMRISYAVFCLKKKHQHRTQLSTRYQLRHHFAVDKYPFDRTSTKTELLHYKLLAGIHHGCHLRNAWIGTTHRSMRRTPTMR